MDVPEIRELVKSDLKAVDALIVDRLSSEVALVNQLGGDIINSGGKRLRPLLVLLAARACGCEDDRCQLTAAIVEFIHTATLLHDDVVDASDLRRGNDAANAVWGNEAAVLVGDFLYSRSFQMMVDVGGMRIMEILSSATNIIAEGEVLQLMNCNDPDTTEERYLNVIHCKTAKLFEAATQMGAVLAELPEPEEKALARYGMHLGTAFQLIDDVLDFTASSEEMGKNMGDDMAEGKPTLPLIIAMREGNKAQQEIVRETILNGGYDNLDKVMQAIEATGALDYTRGLAKSEADKAIAYLELLPDSPHKEAMISLAHFAVERSY